MVIWPIVWIEALAYLKEFFLILIHFVTSVKDININIFSLMPCWLDPYDSDTHTTKTKNKTHIQRI